MGSIANLHTAFNVVCTLLLLPFNKLLVKLATKTIPDRSETNTGSSLVLEERFLSSPSLALDNARNMVLAMGKNAQDNFRSTLELYSEFSDETMAMIHGKEEQIDGMEDQLNAYLVRLNDRELTQDDNRILSAMFHTVNDMERVGDYVMNIAQTAQAQHLEDTRFTESALLELQTIGSAISEILEMTVECLTGNDVAIAVKVEPLEQTIDALVANLKERHVERLKHRKCSVESGTQFLEILINMERISDHCSNMAVAIVQIQSPNSVHSHEYIRSVHSGAYPGYDEALKQYDDKYLRLLEQIPT
jgi:phosphate:Na+ symporter